MRGKKAREIRRGSEAAVPELPWVVYDTGPPRRIPIDRGLPPHPIWTHLGQVELGQCIRKLYKTAKRYYKQSRSNGQ